MKKITNIFSIQCHRYTNALHYNIMKLCKTDAIIIIHLDLRSDPKFLDIYKGLKNVYIIEDRVSVKWGQFSQIEATLRILKFCQRFDYKYISLISGDDIFFRSYDEFCDFLDRNNGAEFLGYQKEYSSVEVTARLRYIYNSSFYFKKSSSINSLITKFHCYSSNVFRKKNPLYETLPTLYKGSNWFTISRQCVNYILVFLQENSQYKDAFQWSFCGDEIFFQTIVMNSHFSDFIFGKELFDDNLMSLRYIDWNTGPSFPKVFDIHDFISIKTSKCFFARKVDEKISVQELCDYFGS